MNKIFRELLVEKVGKKLNENGFIIVDSTTDYFVFHRKCDSFIEIIQLGKDKFETYITISSSIVFLKAPDENNNINYSFFNEFNNGNIDKINADDCYKKYFLKGNFGREFHYGDIYWALGLGVVGVDPSKKKKPLGFRMKKFNEKTYDKLCTIIIKKLPKIYSWL